MQEIAMQVWKSLDSYSGRAKIDTWAYRVAINTALSWDRAARAKAKSLTEFQVDLSHVPSDGDEAPEEQRILKEFLERLPKLDRAAMLLYLDNVPIPDAADILGVTEGALRVRMHRIRKLFENTYCDDGEKRDVR
jgi:RNA polymerase sigma-70 factor (ECF subfamily)